MSVVWRVYAIGQNKISKVLFADVSRNKAVIAAKVIQLAKNDEHVTQGYTHLLVRGYDSHTMFLRAPYLKLSMLERAVTKVKAKHKRG